MAKHPHPMVFLGDVDSSLVMALVNFLYQGEASIGKEELDDFLKAADHLKFFGLTGGTGETSNAVENFGMERTKERKEKVPKKEVAFDMRTPKIEGNFEAADDPPNEKLLVNSVFSPSKAADVEEKMRSMMERLREKSDYKWVCKVFFSFLLFCQYFPHKVCGRRTKGSRDNMRRHVEKHIDGLSYPCEKCGKVSKSKSGLKMHMVNYHRSESVLN